MGKAVSKVCEVSVSGPLAPFVPAFESRLKALSYTPLTRVVELRVVANMSRWMVGQGFAAADLTGTRMVQYVAARRAAGYTTPYPPRVFTILNEILRERGIVGADAPAPASPLDTLFSSFHRFLLEERGLTGCTAAAYVLRAERFVAGQAPTGDLSSLNAKSVTDAVRAESVRVSVGATQFFVVAVRAFLRFCFIEGRVPVDLSGAVLAITGRRRSPLPQGIDAADAQKLLASCDRRHNDGRRDYAILLVLVRLGLRASEVAALTLDDINWRAGVVVVHGKGHRADQLPLPSDVGEAIAGYLRRGRPKATVRQVFLRTVAPIEGIGRGGISCVVRRACKRVGITPVGAHSLRHTLATEMVKSGVPLPEIAQVLRHRSMTSTAIYARVDIDGLRALAQPWPGGGK